MTKTIKLEDGCKLLNDYVIYIPSVYTPSVYTPEDTKYQVGDRSS